MIGPGSDKNVQTPTTVVNTRDVDDEGQIGKEAGDHLVLRDLDHCEFIGKTVLIKDPGH